MSSEEPEGQPLSARDEMDRLIRITGLNEEQIGRAAYGVFRATVYAYENGDEVVVRNPLLGDRILSRVVIPGYKKSEDYKPS